MTVSGWIGVDFDGTLAHYDGWQGAGRFGPAVPAMLARVLKWVADGVEVRIVTARAADPEEVVHVQEWLERNGLPRLVVTDRKDFAMIELWDDRAIQVQKNTGHRIDGVTEPA